MNTSTPATVQKHEPGGPLDDAIVSFLKQLQEAGYAKESVRNKRTVVRRFADWLQRRHLTVPAINESHVAAFLKAAARDTAPAPEIRARCAGRVLEVYLRGIDLIRAPAPCVASPGDDLIRSMCSISTTTAGLAPNSVLVYRPFIRDYLSDHIARRGGVAMDAFDAATIQRFLVDQTRHRSREYARLLATGAALLLSVSLLWGHQSTDLSRAVPTVCTYRHATVPAFLSPEQVAPALAATGSVDARRTSRLRHRALARATGPARGGGRES